ncbi:MULTISPECIES: DUF1499 domain-containing protein [unclassified Vibrio]|uniref:DUF1499 domain-containing protein n=1 Tax=Vibrio sp. HB236076 TaxID=3232307 RepID=A0AB39HF59_9VIBR|nr:DUF1499 domain-containing protein [Vibrio sp. HB161653]MDP5254567.1 DUF1499 domain-containing protein [Vibrio sp. HB161653]
MNQPFKAKIDTPCGDKPNCVASVDQREDFHIAPWTLTPSASFIQVVSAIQSVPSSKLISKTDDYAHFTFTSRWLKFVDDVEIQQRGDQVFLRSESRIGHSDFGVNRKRMLKLGQKLKQLSLII